MPLISSAIFSSFELSTVYIKAVTHTHTLFPLSTFYCIKFSNKFSQTKNFPEPKNISFTFIWWCNLVIELTCTSFTVRYKYINNLQHFSKQLHFIRQSSTTWFTNSDSNIYCRSRYSYEFSWFSLSSHFS